MADLILLHGALGSKEQLAPLEDALREHFAVYRFNLPGHGGAALEPYNFSIAGFASALKDFIAENNISNPSVFGYSMGGFVALYAAAEQMISLNKIITLATKFEWSPEIAAKEISMLDPEMMQAKVPAFVETLSKRHAPQNWKEHLRLTAALMQDLGRDNPLTEDRLSKIDSACLLMLGDSDKMVSENETRIIENLLPNGTFYVLPNTSHPIEKVDTTLLADKIHHFLL